MDNHQTELFATAAAGPAGWLYRPDFLDRAEEASLLAVVAALPLAFARYKAYTARRKVASYGGTFDYERNRLDPGPPVPAALHPLRAKVAAWAGLPPEAFAHALVAEYAPGTPLGWHRDVPDFEVVAGVSLGGAARMRFRPWPPQPTKRADALDVELAPRSAYLLRDDARWRWQHSIAPTREPRWSITFRTRRGLTP